MDTTTANHIKASYTGNQEKRYGRPQIIRVLVSGYLADLREIRTSAKRS